MRYFLSKMWCSDPDMYLETLLVTLNDEYIEQVEGIRTMLEGVNLGENVEVYASSVVSPQEVHFISLPDYMSNLEDALDTYDSVEIKERWAKTLIARHEAYDYGIDFERSVTSREGTKFEFGSGHSSTIAQSFPIWTEAK